MLASFLAWSFITLKSRGLWVASSGSQAILGHMSRDRVYAHRILKTNGNSLMSTEMFLRLDGIEGASRNYAHKGWMEIRAWNWGLQRVRKTAPDGKGTREVLSMNRITVTKAVSIETPLLMGLMMGRKPCAAEISAIPQVGKRETAPKILHMALENVLVQSIDTGIDINQEESLETLVLFFTKVKFEHYLHTKEVRGGEDASTEMQSFEWEAGA